MRCRPWLALLLLLPACSAPSPPAEPPYDPAAARAALVAALDAWKRGDARALPRRQPPIRFVDDDLVEGFRLVDYALDDPEGPPGPHADASVILQLRDPTGRTTRRDARYQIALQPGLAVLRSDR